MYNRYIPSDDGTYRRQVVNDARPAAPQRAKPPQKKPEAKPPAPAPQFQLFGMDTADLILLLILLLLMMDGGCDNTSLLLAIVLYFVLQ